MGHERAERDPEKERREPSEPVTPPPPPSPPQRRPDAERLAQPRRAPGLREDGEPVAERQREDQQRDFLSGRLPPSPSLAPEPSAAEEARAREEAAEGGGDQATERRRGQCDGLGLRAAAAATAAADDGATAAADGGGEEGEVRGFRELRREHLARQAMGDALELKRRGGCSCCSRMEFGFWRLQIGEAATAQAQGWLASKRKDTCLLRANLRGIPLFSVKLIHNVDWNLFFFVVSVLEIWF